MIHIMYLTSIIRKRRQIGCIGSLQVSCGPNKGMIRPQEPTQTDPNNPNKKGKNKKLKQGEGGDSIHPCPTLLLAKWGVGFPLQGAQPTWFTMCLVGLSRRTPSQPYMQLVLSFRSTRHATSICM